MSGWADLGSQVPPSILWQCQLIPCSRQEACTAVSPKLELHALPALCPEVLAARGWEEGEEIGGQHGGSLVQSLHVWRTRSPQLSRSLGLLLSPHLP